MRMLWWKSFPEAPKWCKKTLTGSLWTSRGNFQHQNTCTDLTENVRGKPWGVPNRSHCAFEQSAGTLTACFMRSRRSWLFRARVHVQKRRWLSRLERSGCWIQAVSFLIRLSVYPLFQRSFFFLLCLPSLNLAFHKVQRLHLTLNFSSSIIKKFIFTLTDVSIWLPFLTVGCVGWMDSGSCTHCICSMAALQEPAGKFDVDERGSKEGHPRSRSLSYSGGALQQCHPRWQKQSLQACLNCTGIIRKPNFII